MRTLGLSLLVSAAVAVPVAAWSQDSQPPASADEYVCAFSGECAAEDAEEPAEATPAGPRPRLSATRGFAISTNRTPRASTPQPRRPAGNGARPTRPARFSFAAAQPPGARNQRVNLSLTFPTGSAALTAAAAAQARTFGQALLMPQLATMRFRIEGHTDGVGSRAGQCRACRSAGRRASPTIWSRWACRAAGSRCSGYGPDRPLPGTARTSPQNRRVEAVRVS